MKRRQLLAGMTTGLMAAIAGCGYAYGGGDIRNETRVEHGGLQSATFYETDEDRIAVLTSGRQFVFRDETGEYMEVASVEVVNRDGETQWEFRHETRATALALGERVYLLDQEGHIVASELPPSESGPDIEVGEAWRVALDAENVTIEAGQDTLYVGTADRLLAIRDGAIDWEQSIPESIVRMYATAGVVILSTQNLIVAFEQEGRKRWQRPKNEEVSMTSRGDQLLVWPTGSGSTGAGSETALLDLETGEMRWSVTTERTVTVGSMIPERVALSTDRRISVLDADTGERLWSREDNSLEEVVIGSGGVYGVGFDCTVVAVEPDGRRWERGLEIRDCTVIDGWLDGNTVAFLFESGDIVWLQRTDQSPGLLW